MSREEEMLEVKKVIKTGNKTLITKAICSYCSKYMKQDFKPVNFNHIFDGEVVKDGSRVLPTY